MKISSLPFQTNVIATLVSELYRHWFGHQNFVIYTFDIMVSCDSQAANPRLLASIVVVVIAAMYGERWLAWLPKVCNYKLAI